MLSRVPSSAARRRGLSMPALGGSGILPPLGLAPAAVAAQSLVAVGVARGVCVPPSGAGSVRLASSLVCGGALWLLSLCCLPGLWWSLAALPWLLWPRPGGGRWSVRRCRVALGVGGCGRRRGRFPAPWSCRCSHWDEIHQQRVIVQGGGFGFGPFVPAPAPINSTRHCWRVPRGWVTCRCRSQPALNK